MAEANLSDLERTKRFDSEYFQSRYTVPLAELAEVTTENITELTSVSDGNHFSISDDFAEEGVPYYRGQDVTGNFFVEQAAPNFITETAYLQPHMYRSHLQKNDVLLSIVGTIGELSLVSESKQATCSCKLAILRPGKINSAYLAVFLRSRYGQAQIQRLTRGAVQMGLLLEDMNQVNVARFSPDFENAVAETVEIAKQQLENSTKLQQQAEALLLAALGLEHWQPPEALTYERSAKDVFGAERLDAEHFKKKYVDLAERLKATGQAARLGELLVRNERGKQPIYSEFGSPVVNSKHVMGGQVNITDDNRSGEDSTGVSIQYGDVVMNGTGVGTIGRAAPYLHTLDALPDNHVTVLRPKQDVIDPVYLSVFLNSRLGQMQVDQRLRGSSGQIELYPVDIAEFLVWDAPKDTQRKIRDAVVSSFDAKQRSAQLLDLAKRAVEIAIEESEAAALAYLRTGGQSA